MYVQCERCKTEYDFDDALVSERGTTVKCTQCGHQFKVRRSAASDDGASDRWVVTTVSGKTLVYTSLRELQKAILGKQVARSDSLSRGTAPPRLLGAIAELEPFFDKRASVPPAADVEPATNRKPSVRATPQPPNAEPTRRVDTLRPPPGAYGPPPAPTVPRDPPTATSSLASTLQHVGQPITAEAFVPRPAVRAPQPEPSATVPAFIPQQMQAPPQPQPRQPSIPDLPPPTRPVHHETPMPPPHRSYAPQPSIPPEDDYAPRGRVGGWIVAFMLFAGVCVIGFVVAQKYLSHSPKPAAALAPLDPKAQQLLSDGERAFADGNLEEAKEDFVKAGEHADKDPRVLLDVAQVDEARADVAWLALRLATGGEAQTQARKELDELSVKSSAAADAALAVTPDDARAVRSKIDALRIAGDLAQARSLVVKMTSSSIASQPMTEYVLAALDLAESSTLATQVLDRLRDAAGAEGNLGRARAALVYALARSGDPASARRELEKLLHLPRQHPLQAELRAFVDRAAQAQQATGTDAGPVAVIDINTLPAHGNEGAADPRSLNQQADAARAKGDYARAKDLYGRSLAANPSDSEALAGLGDCAYAQRDMENAKTYYKRALAANNTYTPAMIGLADALWETGEHTEAQKMYKDIVDRLPETMVPQRAKDRAAESTAAPAHTDGGS